MLSTAALVLLIPTLATALPAVHQNRNRTLLARDDGGGDMNPSIIVNKDGNIVLDFQDGMLNLIDTPPSKILDQLHKQCDQFGCGATPFTVDVKVLNKQLQLDDAKITVDIQQAHYDGNLKDNLISTLQSGGDAVAKTEQVRFLITLNKRLFNSTYTRRNNLANVSPRAPASTARCTILPRTPSRHRSRCTTAPPERPPRIGSTSG
jgi:hypothetical protein